MQPAKIVSFPQKEHASDVLKVRLLPAQPTPLIGREREVASAGHLLQNTDVRLLTLTGTAGVGKTRLALQVATDLSDDFADGISFIPLASISDPTLVVPAIVQTLGLGETTNLPLFDLLNAYLQHKHLLLPLDNFEQVVRAAPLLAKLLETCPEVKMLVTSREVLHLRAEHQYLVPHRTEQEEEEPRLVMLETIREYGLKYLEANGEIEATRRAHALYYLALAEEAEPKLVNAEQLAWFDRLEREHDNLRAALQWLLGQSAGGEREMALRLGGALQRLWQARGHLSKGRTFLERTLAESEGTPSPVPYKGLTTREREVATLIAQGKTNRSIAVMLVVSERTVEAHVSNILAKLDVTSRSQIAVWAGCSDVLKPAGGLLQKQSHPRF